MASTLIKLILNDDFDKEKLSYTPQELQSIFSELTYDRLEKITSQLWHQRQAEIRGVLPSHFIVHHALLSHMERVYHDEMVKKQFGFASIIHFLYRCKLIGAVNVPIDVMICL